MVVRNLYVNGNSDGEPRAVANSLLIFSQVPESVAAENPLIPAIELTAGDSLPISIPIAGEGVNGAKPLWGSLDGRGFIDQRGIINTRRAGASEVGAWINGSLIRIPYTVKAAAASELSAVFAPAPNNPPDRKMVVIKLRDRFGNAVVAQRVYIRVSGGVPEQPEVTTDSAGRAEIEVVWDSEKGGQVTVTTGVLAPTVLKTK